MPARSNLPGDIAAWIESIIDSCETKLQELTARKLIQNFERLLLEQKNPNFAFFSRTLRDKLDSK